MGTFSHYCSGEGEEMAEARSVCDHWPFWWSLRHRGKAICTPKRGVNDGQTREKTVPFIKTEHSTNNFHIRNSHNFRPWVEMVRFYGVIWSEKSDEKTRTFPAKSASRGRGRVMVTTTQRKHVQSMDLGTWRIHSFELSTFCGSFGAIIDWLWRATQPWKDHQVTLLIIMRQLYCDLKVLRKSHHSLVS